MWALDLDLEEFDISDNIEDGYHDLISDLVSASTPGTLTKLSTLDPRFDDFIATVEDAQVDDEKCGLTLYNDQSELDQVFSSIKILHLQGLYPQWRSPAYHGLVDLRITPTYEEPGPLSELEFITMLRASPKLRILHFGYPIINRSEGNASDIRLVLNELEVLQITSFELGSFGVALEPHDVFRLISPSPKLLHFAMHCHPRNEDELTVDLSLEDTEAFLERAKVAKLCASRYSLPDRLFQMSSHLKVLILEEYQHTLSPSLPTNQRDKPSVSPPVIEHYYMLHSSIDLDRFCLTIQQCSIQGLVFFKCKFYSGGEEVAEGGALEELLHFCPVVEFPSKTPSLTAHQELLT